jgi:hypothetical protein
LVLECYGSLEAIIASLVLCAEELTSQLHYYCIRPCSSFGGTMSH